MGKSEKSKVDRNLILLIILFVLLSLSIILGRLMFKDSNQGSRVLASAQGSTPVITRIDQPADEEPPQEMVQQMTAPVEEDSMEQQEEMDARLFFFLLNDDSQITLKSVLRPIPSHRYSLEESILELLNGPGATDLDRGYLSLIPKNTRLNEVRVVSRTARLDFSEEFAYNPLGYEGFNHQLKQIVYTATEFNHVDQVLFTINGELREYISAEGIYTGEPLSRDSF